MSICKCCENTTQGTPTCSKEHGMAWRYLKDKNLTKEQIKEIIDIKTQHPIKIKYIIWLQGLKEEPKCIVCGGSLSFKKLLVKSNICSKECNAKHKQQKKPKKVCLICGDTNCKKAKCKTTKRELSTISKNTEEYINYLKNKYIHLPEDVLLYHNLNKRNLDDIPKCKFCGDRHYKLDNDCCSRECGNIYKNSKKSYHDIVSCYLDKGIPFKFLETLGKKTLGSVFNNKRKDIILCSSCNKWFVSERTTYCSSKCSSSGHFIHDINLDELEKFIDNGLFDVKQATKYFNCSETTIRRSLKQFDIQNRTKYTIEEDVCCSFDIDFIKNNRTVIYPKEIDILSEDYNFGIEYNGLLWHSSGKDFPVVIVDKNKHLEKTEMLESKGYQLFHIFENEWKLNKEKWISVINNKIGSNNKIYARKCTIGLVEADIAKEFENTNHLQGSGISSIRIGLYYNNELISLMTFGKSRFNKNIEYELIRFCSKLNTTVVGGASKLLKYFERNYRPNTLISYANRRWSQGNIYKTLGFKFIKNTEPNYFYFKPGKDVLHSRHQFQKHKLNKKLSVFDVNLSESDNMFNNGYRKIYDCGDKVYIKSYK